jgi:hypothetical protein
VITLAQHLSLNHAMRSQPQDRHRSAPNPGACVETTRRDPSDTTTLADEVVRAIARLLGRQLAREWYRAEG